jgi:hypothetical protein
MVWSQYIEDAAAAPGEDDDHFDGDQEIEYPLGQMELEDWITWFSTDLMNMWMSLRQYRSDASVNNYIMDFASYSDFCDFCYQTSCKYPNSHPS